VYANDEQVCESEICLAKRHNTSSPGCGRETRGKGSTPDHEPYRDFVNEPDPERKNEAGRELIRAIFGKDSLAEDSVF
jgi:hypothetical protein